MLVGGVDIPHAGAEGDHLHAGYFSPMRPHSRPAWMAMISSGLPKIFWLDVVDDLDQRGLGLGLPAGVAAGDVGGEAAQGAGGGDALGQGAPSRR